MATSWNTLQSQLYCSLLLTPTILCVCHLQSILTVSTYNTNEPNTCHHSEYYPHLNITATSDQSLQEDFFYLNMVIFIHAGNHGLVLLIDLKRMKPYVNVGFVNTLVPSFFRAFLCI